MTKQKSTDSIDSVCTIDCNPVQVSLHFSNLLFYRSSWHPLGNTRDPWEPGFHGRGIPVPLGDQGSCGRFGGPGSPRESKGYIGHRTPWVRRDEEKRRKYKRIASCRRRAANCTDLSTHRSPIFGTPINGNAHESGTPNPSLNAGGATFPPEGAKLHRLFHSSERPLIRTPNRWERHCNKPRYLSPGI